MTVDTIQLQDASGGSDLGTYGVDWTVTMNSGTIDGQDSNGLNLSDDADGIITLSDGSTVNFYDIEVIVANPRGEQGLVTNWQMDSDSQSGTRVNDEVGDNVLSLINTSDIIPGSGGGDSDVTRKRIGKIRPRDIFDIGERVALSGGLGNDTLNGGDGSDMFIFQMGGGTDTVNGGAGGGWTDTIQLQDASGGSVMMPSTSSERFRPLASTGQ